MEDIKYIGFYFIPEKENRSGSLAAVTKMNCVAKAISGTGASTKIISPSWYTNPNNTFEQSCSEKIAEDITLIRAPSWGTKSRIAGAIKTRLTKIWLTQYLLRHLKSGEVVVVYHSLWLISVVNILKKAKHIKLILETNEIYTDVVGGTKRKKNQEISFIKSADAFIFPTELMNCKLNEQGKPYLINSGTYLTEPQRLPKFNDGKIHCVYAGTFEPQKGGAAAAATAAKFLDEKYHIHIMGFGSEEEIADMQSFIKTVSESTQCTVTYDGMKTGDEYIEFIQSCDIGLSTQNPEGAFNDTSFPSKVLSYLANGLSVVSVRIKALECSVVNNLICYYDTNSPESIVSAIKAIDLSRSCDSRDYINQLNRDFMIGMKTLFEELEPNGKQ